MGANRHFEAAIELRDKAERLINLGQYDNAIVFLTNALEIFNDLDHIDEARECADRLQTIRVSRKY